MFIPLGTDPEAARRAAVLCGLEVAEGPQSFVYGSLVSTDLPPWVNSLATDFDPDRPEFVLRLAAAAAARCSRTPHEVGVFAHRGCYYAVWDGDKDGFGLLAYIGPRGERLRTHYVIEALATLAPRLGLTRGSAHVGADEVTTLEFRDAMAQKKIKVRVGPTGDTVISTEGFQGTACKDATKQLEAALGTVTGDKATQEMYTPPEQVTSINN